jgi:hypothetical protein
MKPSQLREALLFHGRYRQPVIALAQPGVGKSTIFRQVFDELGLPHHTVNLALSDGTDLKGMPTFTDHNGAKAIRWAKETVFLSKNPMAIFLDEIFQAQTQVMNAAAPVILENRVDDVFLHAGSWVCGASNRTEDKAGTNRVPSHIPNRCTLLYGPDVNVDEWTEYLLQGGSSKTHRGEYQDPLPAPIDRDWRVGQFLRMKPNYISEFEPTEMINATPRQWEWVAQFLPVIPESVRFDILHGRIGKGRASELLAFIKIQDQLPTKEEILLRPTKAKVPDEPSALYIVTGMLAQASNATTFDSVCKYAERIPPEFQAMLVKDAMTIAPEITSTKAFVSWGVKFAEVLR